MYEDLNKAIRETEAQRGEAQKMIDQCTAFLKESNASPKEYDEHSLDLSRSNLALALQRRAERNERLLALYAQRPSDAECIEAAASIAVLASDAAQAHTAYADAWSRLIIRLEQACTECLALDHAVTVVRQARSAVERLSSDYSIAAPAIADVPTPELYSLKYSWACAELIRSIAYYQTAGTNRPVVENAKRELGESRKPKAVDHAVESVEPTNDNVPIDVTEPAGV